nr:ribonuclease H-like domain-containing protein [Tanacetum cinerariifolium]
MEIDGVGWDWSFMGNEQEDHALFADEEVPTEFALMAKTSAESEVFDNSLCSKNSKKNTKSLNNKITDLDDKLFGSKNMLFHYKACLAQVEEFLKKEKGELETKLTGFQSASKDLDSLLESQRLDKNKEGLGYNVVPPPPAQVYSLPKKDMSWTGVPEFEDYTVTDYSRPSPTIESTSDDVQNKNTSVTKTKPSLSTISPKPFIKFVKAINRSTETKTTKVETAKPTVKYAAMYSKPSKSSKNACYNCIGIDHLSYDCGKGVDHGSSWAKNNNTRKTLSYNKRPFQRTSAMGSQFRDPRVATVIRKFSTVNRKLPTVNRKFPTGNTKFSTADMGNKGKAVKASACWFWKPSNNLSSKGQNFKLSDDANVLLRTPRQHNMYSIDLNNIVPHKDLTCLVAKASAEECMQWNRRL